MKLSQFNFPLKQEMIATEPSRWRDECRLMVLNRQTGEIEHKIFKDILSFNDTLDDVWIRECKVDDVVA